MAEILTLAEEASEQLDPGATAFSASFDPSAYPLKVRVVAVLRRTVVGKNDDTDGTKRRKLVCHVDEPFGS